MLSIVLFGVATVQLGSSLETKAVLRSSSNQGAQQPPAGLAPAASQCAAAVELHPAGQRHTSGKQRPDPGIRAIAIQAH